MRRFYYRTSYYLCLLPVLAKEYVVSKIAAFFDMDNTLLSKSSNLLWIRYMRQRGELAWRDLARLAGLVVRYKLGTLDVPAMTRRLVQELRGQPESERVTFSKEWFAEQLIHYIARPARERLDWHREQGHRVALITGSPTYTAEALAEYLRIATEDVLATRFEVRDGRFTGRLVEPMCYGVGKVEAALAYAARYGIDLARSYFYTDSVSDQPLLERVGHPIAVNPDRALKKLARARNWPIMHFY